MCPTVSGKALPDVAVEIDSLVKTYKGRAGQPEKKALDGVSLSVPRGSFFALLGPNGAGKSTLINILAGLVTKSSGSARIWGHDVAHAARAARLSIGVVPQELNLDPFFSPRELLEVQAGLYGVPAAMRRTNAILEAVGLADKADAHARTLSGGMRRRLLVAKAMVHAPPVLVLDEPTAGVDIQLRQQLWSYVGQLNRQGTTILLTTHYLEEAERLCDRIAIIDRGRVVANDRTDRLLNRLGSKRLVIICDRDLDAIPSGLEPFHPEQDGPRTLRLFYKPGQAHAGAVLEIIRSAGIGISDLSTEEADLEDVFLKLTSGQQGSASS